MAATIDWMYRRNFCNTCEKAEAFLQKHGVTVKATVDARKEKMNQAALLALAKSVDVILTVKGKSVLRLDLKKDKPGQKAILAAMLGPTGNLRAPTFRKGRVLFVGFQPEGYGEVLKLN